MGGGGGGLTLKRLLIYLQNIEGKLNLTTQVTKSKLKMVKQLKYILTNWHVNCFGRQRRDTTCRVFPEPVEITVPELCVDIYNLLRFFSANQEIIEEKGGRRRGD